MDVSKTAVVFAGGDPEPASVRSLIPPDSLVIAADSGLDLVASLDLTVDVVVGDFDSVNPELLQAAVASGARVERHPVDKDATDLELALEAALTAGVGRVIVVGGSGGRMDHFLANALLLASPRFAALRPEWWTDGTRVVAIHDSADFSGRVGDLLTLLAVGGAATGVSSEGLKWPLRADTLQPGSTRGVSNEFTGESARVSVDSGVLLGVHQRRER